MRPTLLTALLLTAPAAGQEPLAPAAPPAGYPADALLPAPAANPWRTDVIVGLPLAVRVQRQVPDTRAWLEGGLSTYGPFPGGFVGLRLDGRRYAGRSDFFQLRPGLDVYYSPVRSGGGFLFPRFNGLAAVIADCDLSWQYCWSDRFHTGAGLKLGIGPGFIAGHVFPVPVLGLTLGCQF